MHVTTETHVLLWKDLNISCMVLSKSMRCVYLFVGQHFIRLGTKLYRQVVGIAMGTNCAPLVADLFPFCYERDFMMCLSDDKQADIIKSF